MQEMGFVRETDRALATALMSEFVRLQLIVGEDLNTSLRVMHAEMETTTSEILRDLDIASHNAMEVPSANPSVRVALDRFNQLVKLKLVPPLTQLDAAREDMEWFLHYRLSQLHAQTELRSLLRNLTERMAAQQCRVCQIVQGEALKNIEVSQQVLVGLGADQPIESNFFPGVLEGLLGSLGINAAGGKPPQPPPEKVLPGCGLLQSWKQCKRWKREMSPSRPSLGCHRDCISVMKMISCSAGLPRCLKSSQTPSSYPA